MSNDRQETISARIKKALRIKGMKQADLCQITKIPKSSLSQYLSGDFEPKQDRIYLISKALNVSEAWLMGFDVPMERRDPQKVSPTASNISEGEQMWMELYHRLSSETRELLIHTMGGFDRLPKDKQQLALQMLRVALGDRE